VRIATLPPRKRPTYRRSTDSNVVKVTRVNFSAKFFVGSLLVFAVAIYAAISLSDSLGQPTLRARDNRSTTLTQNSSRESLVPDSNGLGQAVPPLAGAGEASAAAARPDGSVHSTGNGMQRFADSGPGIVLPEAPQPIQMCGPKRCPLPQRYGQTR
jgi:hypothetical protein